MEVKSYGGNGWAVFIMSAEGAVSNVTLHQPASPLEIVIHEVCSIVLAWNLYTRNPFSLACFQNKSSASTKLREL